MNHTWTEIRFKAYRQVKIFWPFQGLYLTPHAYRWVIVQRDWVVGNEKKIQFFENIVLKVHKNENILAPILKFVVFHFYLCLNIKVL